MDNFIIPEVLDTPEQVEALIGDDTTVVTISPILFDHAAACSSSSSAISAAGGGLSRLLMEDLWSLKEFPTKCTENLRLDNTEELATELIRMMPSADRSSSTTGSRTLLLLDTSTTSSGRNITGLRSVITGDPRLSKLYHMAFCTGPSSSTDSSFASMRSELIAGVPLGNIALDGGYTRAAAMSIQISSPYSFMVSTLTSAEVACLEEIAKVHREWSTPTSSSTSGTPGISTSLSLLPPIIISAGHFAITHESICEILHRNGGDTSRVIFCQVSLRKEAQQLQYWENLLTKYKCTISVDSFGYAASFTPLEGPSWPSDAELIEAVDLLCDHGFALQVHLSVNMRAKTQLTKYGGHGYDFIARSILPRILAGHENGIYPALTPTTVTAITGENIVKLLKWYKPPPPAEIAIETMDCYICGKQFIPGAHYSKFAFVYCTSKCLGEHRRADWKEKE